MNYKTVKKYYKTMFKGVNVNVRGNTSLNRERITKNCPGYDLRSTIVTSDDLRLR